MTIYEEGSCPHCGGATRIEIKFRNGETVYDEFCEECDDRS